MAYTPRPIYTFNPAFQAPEMHEALVVAYDQWLVRHSHAEKLRLYHYTDLAGLRGILRDRSLWCTQIYSLNDPSEIEYGLAVVKRVIDNIISTGSTETAFLEKLKRFISMSYGPLLDPYTISFSENDDLLSQWRAYANEGRGYSIGFEFSDLTQICAQPATTPADPSQLIQDRYPFLRKVVYDPTEQESLVESFLLRATSAVTQARNGSIPRLIRRNERSAVDGWLAAHASNFLTDLIVSFKNPRFSEENKWRLVRVVPEYESADETSFRETDEMLIPYRATCVFDVSQDLIEGEMTQSISFPLFEIVTGPSSDGNQALRAARTLLRSESTSEHPI